MKETAPVVTPDLPGVGSGAWEHPACIWRRASRHPTDTRRCLERPPCVCRPRTQTRRHTAGHRGRFASCKRLPSRQHGIAAMSMPASADPPITVPSSDIDWGNVLSMRESGGAKTRTPRLRIPRRAPVSVRVAHRADEQPAVRGGGKRLKVHADPGGFGKQPHPALRRTDEAVKHLALAHHRGVVAENGSVVQDAGRAGPLMPGKVVDPLNPRPA